MKTLFSQDSFQKAWNFASKAHKGQKIPGSDIPYLNHIGNVVMEVIAGLSTEENDDPDLAVQCAILHDVLEDTEVTFDEIEKEFGREVAEGVLSLTKNEKLPTKTEQMVESIGRILIQEKQVQMVKLADRITNLQPPPAHWNKEKVEKYRSEAKLIYDSLKDANAAMAERLKQKIDEYPPAGQE